MPRPQQHKMSSELDSWLSDPASKKTIGGLNEAFAEKSFALALLLLLFPSALPLPTGGVTNVLEILAVILSLQMIMGREEMWLPKRWKHVELGKYSKEKIMSRLIRFFRWAERISRRNLQIQNDKSKRRFVGVVFCILIVAAFTAPPFSGLDTLPSLGVVLIATSMLVEDRAIFALGMLIGSIGIALVLLSWLFVFEAIFS